MLVNQTLFYSASNNTNNILFKLCENSFNAVRKKRLKGAHSPLYFWAICIVTEAEFEVEIAKMKTVNPIGFLWSSLLGGFSVRWLQFWA